MNRLLLVCFTIIFLASCKDKHVSLSGDAKVDVKDFVAAFPAIKLPYKVADSNMVKVADTTTISYTVFSEFVPDSVLQNVIGKNAKKIKIHPVGKIEKDNETYLLANFSVNGKTSMICFLFDKENKYHASLPLLKQNLKDGYVHSVSVTIEPTFIISQEKRNAMGDLSYTRNGYAYNSGSSDFIIVMNDSNEDLKRINEIINPIDTFPAANKWSGDYVQDKKDFISVRDGSSSNKYIFFIHFEKNDGDCTGELKGIMTMRDATHAVYEEGGDPCEIDFTFTSNNITVKERGNCGNHRGIKCFFDDTYKKKKTTKATPKKSK